MVPFISPRTNVASCIFATPSRFKYCLLVALAVLTSAATVSAQAQPWLNGTGGIYYPGGNVAIGPTNTAPQSLLHISGSGGAGAITFDTPGTQKFRFTSLPGIPNWGGLTLNGKYNSGWYLDDTASQGGFFKLDGRASDAMSTGMWLYRIPAGANPHTDETPVFGITGSTLFAAGSVSIGGVSNGFAPASPSQALHVYGAIKVDGDITGAHVIGAVYQDVAEWVPASGDVPPGTVVVLNPDKSNAVIPSSKAYDSTVAGVVSAHPGVLLGEAADWKVKVATTGRVKVRVDATRAAVKIGDLLVTGEEAGTAMVSQPVIVNGIKMHRPGTLIGKA